MEREKQELTQTRDMVKVICKVLLILLAAQLLILGIIYPDWSGLGVITFIFTMLQKLFMFFLRGIVEELNAWYDDFFLAPALVFLLKCVIPLSLLAALGYWWMLESKLKDETPPVVQLGVQVKRNTDSNSETTKRCEVLQKRGKKYPLLSGDPGVRVQLLDSAIEGKKDYVARWDQNGEILIIVAEDLGVYLRYFRNQQTGRYAAYIEGVCERTGKGEQNDYRLLPLIPKSPLVITRGDGTRCLAITWLGGDEK